MRILKNDYFKPAFILGHDSRIQKGLRVFVHANGEFTYYPTRFNDNDHTIDRFGHLYQYGGDDLEPLSRALKILNKTPNYSAFFKTAATPRDVRIRQNATRELIDNPDLFHRVEELLRTQEFITEHPRGEQWKFGYDLSEDKLKRFVEGLAALKTTAPQSVTWRRAIAWAENLQHDTLFSEHFREKRHAADSRIFQVYSERMANVQYGILKPGVKPEDVFDMLDTELIEVPQDFGQKKKPRRSIVRFDRADDRNLSQAMLERGKQDMNALNLITNQMLLRPATFMYLQLQQPYMQALLYKRFQQNGPVAFPEIGDRVQLENIQPVRMALERVYQPIREAGVPITIDLPIDTVHNIEGPNRSGKTEAWRTLYLASTLFTAGAPVPAERATLPVFPTFTFIHAKGDAQYGGSEFEHTAKTILEAIAETGRSGALIIDEFGDATNAPTAVVKARRLLSVLRERDKTVFITTQHGAINGEITSLGGHNHTTEGYAITPSTGSIDYRAEETLDAVGFTETSIREAIDRKPRHMTAEQAEAEAVDEGPEHDDLPF